MQRAGLISYFLCQLQKLYTFSLPKSMRLSPISRFLRLSSGNQRRQIAIDCLLVRWDALSSSESPFPAPACRRWREKTPCLAPGRHDGCHLNFPRNRYPPLINDGGALNSILLLGLSPPKLGSQHVQLSPTPELAGKLAWDNLQKPFTSLYPSAVTYGKLSRFALSLYREDAFQKSCLL